MLWSLIFAFLKDILTGDLFRIWQAHKVKEAQNASNDVAGLSDSDLDRRVLHDITRKL